ncbi:MAG: GTP-binding protein [Runella slithyformis]|nr:MAG: GTP-binding protein [Runella slithyformis]TAF00811.1 MAG: GTP-binding protein [Runella slithyformis]TAF24401.1 MAG: GTP-binding protein [Runella slithyformis]TAF49386.1 MAG: GTP-binding protein [Runella slithyformis]TAF79282.1 MAG: GTP-binding protein [Runella slithyformis]
MDILRFITAGSVDDGKSTLIGRLLYDTKNILADQLEAVERASKTRGDGEIDLALLTDGLRSEREQGITIDVAYKYFQTDKRKFISIDAPGHIQYTRNMVTGASNADLAIILVDARQGVIEQTRRHSLITSLLNIPHIVVAINKMDLVGYSEDRFLEIAQDYQQLAHKLGIKKLKIIPVSALAGDNIVDKSLAMPWYTGHTMLQYLESVDVLNALNLTDARFSVQYVLRPQTEELHDYRGYAGFVQSGVFRKGDAITVFPSEQTAKIAKIEQYGQEIEEARAGMSVTILLETDVDVSRGYLLAKSDNLPVLSQDVEATICWMDDRKELKVGGKYTLQHGTTRTRCSVRGIEYRIDVNNYEQIEDVESLKLNDIAKVVLRTAQPLAYDDYQKNRVTGAAILIDETSNVTVGACMLA